MEGVEDPHPRLVYQSNLVITLLGVSLMFSNFINTTNHHLGQCGSSSPSTKELNEHCIINETGRHQHQR